MHTCGMQILLCDCYEHHVAPIMRCSAPVQHCMLQLAQRAPLGLGDCKERQVAELVAKHMCSGASGLASRFASWPRVSQTQMNGISSESSSSAAAFSHERP